MRRAYKLYVHTYVRLGVFFPSKYGGQIWRLNEGLYMTVSPMDSNLCSVHAFVAVRVQVNFRLGQAGR